MRSRWPTCCTMGASGFRTSAGTRGRVEPLRACAASGRPFLGICLGMQMLVAESEEFGRHEGLGIVPGKVVGIAGRANGVPVKVPHIGWNALARPEGRARWDGTIL